MNETKPWTRWFDEKGKFLGESSARTKPDLRTAQPCPCEQCNTPAEQPAGPLDLAVKQALLEPLPKRKCRDIGATYVKAYGEFCMAKCEACGWRGPQRLFGALETIKSTMDVAEADRSYHVAGGAA